MTSPPVVRRARARPMSPDERREAIVTATAGLLAEHGAGVTTRQIAVAAGIAEGTIFRVFGSKEDIYEAVLARAFDPSRLLADLDALDPALPLRQRLLALTELMQRRFQDIFALMIALGAPRPPHHDDEASAARHQAWRAEVLQRIVALLEDDAEAFRLPVADVVRMLRLLTFAGSHPHISEGDPLAAEEIVGVILHGTLAAEGAR